MSARALAELEAEQRRAGGLRIERQLHRFKRFHQLYVDGQSDAQIGEALGVSRQTVLMWRQLLTLDVGNKAAGMGRLRKRVRELMEALR